jgi:methylase of polypeptide subunit release factors
MAEISAKLNESYWDEFYKRDFVHIPSQFCALVATDIEPNATVVELGCVNGRDSHFFSSANFSVIGVDLSPGAIKACKVMSDRTKDIQFICGDISDKKICQDVRQILDIKSPNGDISFYSRFVIHSIDERQEKLFMLGLRGLMAPRDRIFFEFRSQEDQSTKKIFENHYRRYIDTDVFIKNLVEIVGVEIQYSITGRGMALYKDEDPIVSRVIAQKN